MSVSPRKSNTSGISEIDSNQTDTRSNVAVYGSNDSDSISSSRFSSADSILIDFRSCVAVYGSNGSIGSFDFDCSIESNNFNAFVCVSSTSNRSTSGAHSEIFVIASQLSSEPSFFESSISGMGSISSFAYRSNMDESGVLDWLARNDFESQSTIESDDNIARDNCSGLDSDDTSLDSDDEMAVEHMQL